MTSSVDLQKLLEQISETAMEASTFASKLTLGSPSNPQPHDVQEHVCMPKTLPESQHAIAVFAAINARRENAPTIAQLKHLYGDSAHIGIKILNRHTSRFWEKDRQVLTVSFIGDFSHQSKSQIIRLMNSWTSPELINFRRTNGIGEVRVARESSGYWSHIGTDILQVPIHMPTTNLAEFEATDDSARKIQMVQHQAGHLLGFQHRGLTTGTLGRLNKTICLDYLNETYAAEKHHVWNALAENELELSSLMSWEFPAVVTNDQEPILANKNLTPADLALFKRVYGTASNSATDLN